MSSPDNTSVSDRHYTALARLFAGRRDAAEPPPRHWQIRKYRRGQENTEIYGFATIVGLITVTGTFERAAALLPFGGWHWLWIAPAALLASFLVLQITALAAAAVGSVSASCGFMPNSPAGSRTSFFFLSTLTVYAAWAATSNTWVAPLGYAWLTLVALNILAAIWLAMRDYEARH